MKPTDHTSAPPPPPRPVHLPPGQLATEPVDQRDPPRRSISGTRPLLILAGVVLGLTLLFGLVRLAVGESGVAETERLPATSAPPAASVAQPTAGGAAEQNPDTLAGQEALEAQDWVTAIAAFRRALESEPDNPLLREQMAESYVGFARKLIKNAPEEGLPRPVDALATIRNTFTYSPTHAYGRALEQRLVLYLEAEASLQKEDWTTAITSLERLHALQSEGFLESRQRLYDAHMSLAETYKSENKLAEMREACQQAAAVEGVDAATAQQCLQASSP